MPTLLLRNRQVDSVFELIGRDENSLTFALGWCLREAPSLLAAIAAALGLANPVEQETSVLLQEFGGKHGFTDVEVRDPGRQFWILEAKVGFLPPGHEQLQKYADRLNVRKDEGAKPVLVVVAQSDRRDVMLQKAGPSAIDGIPVLVLSWGRLLRCCHEAHAQASNSGKRALAQLETFVRKVLLMRDQESNQVYVVSINNDHWEPIGTTFRAVVEEHGRYFHPAGSGWPKTPPNYLAFRWHGQLQSVHHVESYKVVESMYGEFPNASKEQLDPYFLYTLGPAIKSAKTVRTGNIYRAGRVWAALDLLLTCETISDARDQSAARQDQSRDHVIT